MDVSIVFKQEAREWQLKYSQTSDMSRAKFQKIKV